VIETGVREELVRLSRDIHDDPELSYEEHRAVDRICKLLQEHGVAAERNLGGLDTAFRARIGPAGRSVALLAEYDALPEVGHGCGHNLIAMTTVGAFLEIAAQQPRLDVGVELIGAPAEEKGGGKQDLIERGVFGDLIAVLSSHPSSDARWSYGEGCLGIVERHVTFRGAPAHAAFSPELGRNALNGLIRLFIGIDGWRQHLPKDTRVHGVITYGGAAQNVIPERAEGQFGLRARDMRTLEALTTTFAEIARGAALQTGTTVEIREERPYLPLEPNAALTKLLGEELRRHGIEAHEGGVFMASTDLGDVSQIVPTDHIGFPVSATAIPGHSHAMTAASATDLAHENAFSVIAVLAAATRRLATDATLRQRLSR
jgi:amidohydrolase